MSAELPTSVQVQVRGPRVSIKDAIGAARAAQEFFATAGVNTEVTAVWFQCDGCGLRRPDRPRDDEGWTYVDPDDLCPECSVTAP